MTGGVMLTKEKILKSALKLFAKQGIDKTSTAQITKDVGIAEGTLFVHFKTKQELIDSLYLEIKKGSAGNLTELIDPKVSVEKNIKKMSKYLVEYLIKNFNELVFMEIIEKDPQISKKARAEASKIYKDVVLQIDKWIKGGKLKKLNTELIGYIFWTNIVGVSKYCHAKKVKVSDVMLTIIWDAVKK